MKWQFPLFPKPSDAPKKTIHSALFFPLMLLAFLGAILLAAALLGMAVVLATAVFGHAMQEHLPLSFLGVLLLGGLVVIPFMCVAGWMNPRVNVRVKRIRAGLGWGGWTYTPVDRSVSPQERAWRRKLRWHLCWQLPLVLAAAAGWALMLGEVFDTFRPSWQLIVGLIVQAVILVAPSFLLLLRAWPGLFELIEGCVMWGWDLAPEVQSRYAGSANILEKAPSAQK